MRGETDLRIITKNFINDTKSIKFDLSVIK